MKNNTKTIFPKSTYIKNDNSDQKISISNVVINSMRNYVENIWAEVNAVLLKLWDYDNVLNQKNK